MTYRICLTIVFVLLCKVVTLANTISHQSEPTRYGVTTIAEIAYDPPDQVDGFGLINVFALVDYDSIMPHTSPEELRLKFEFNAGLARTSEDPKKYEPMISLNMLALYYVTGSPWPRVHPYGEAGIGVIYTGFRVEGQGLFTNFNPLFGFGVEIETGNTSAIILAVRFHHLSNAGLNNDNRGVNSAGLMLGYMF